MRVLSEPTFIHASPRKNPVSFFLSTTQNTIRIFSKSQYWLHSLNLKGVKGKIGRNMEKNGEIGRFLSKLSWHELHPFLNMLPAIGLRVKHHSLRGLLDRKDGKISDSKRRTYVGS
jgi:hypothetical protein